ncbi:hypothetical protein [Alkalihalobacillus trypoxylicola]|nr:hypothetical protein [Alkalihalobacillus trypoxylicola]
METKLNKGYDLKKSDHLFTEYFRSWYEVFRKGKNSQDNDNDIRRAVEFAEKYFEGIKLKEL